MTFNELIINRRSIRAYDPAKKVAKETIEEIIQAAQLAPSWKNSQTARYYVVCDDAKRAEIVEKAFGAWNQKNSKDAPVLIVTTFVKNIAGYTNNEPDNELGNEWGAYDLGLANSYLILKANELGLDTLIMGLRDSDVLADLLGIDKNVEEVGPVLTLGYRAAEPAAPHRKPLEEIAKFI